MNKETKDSLLNSIPALINNRNVEYETELSLLLRDEGYINLRIGDIRKILKSLDITLKQGKRNNKNISTPNCNENQKQTLNQKKGRRKLTSEELQFNAEKRKYKYQKVIDLLIEKKYSYKEIAQMCNVTDKTVYNVKKEFIDNEDRY
jgi:transposase